MSINGGNSSKCNSKYWVQTHGSKVKLKNRGDNSGHICEQKDNVSVVNVRTRVFYNSSVDSKVVCGLLAKANKSRRLLSNRKHVGCKNGQWCKNRVSVTAPSVPGKKVHSVDIVIDSKDNDQKEIGAKQVSHTSIVDNQCVLYENQRDSIVNACSSINNVVVTSTNEVEINMGLSDNTVLTCIGVKGIHVTSGIPTKQYVNNIDYRDDKYEKDIQMQRGAVDYSLEERIRPDCVKLFDIKDNICDKYFASFVSRGAKHVKATNGRNCENFLHWQNQTDFNFGFTPLGAFVLPVNGGEGLVISSPVDQHERVKASGLPNFLGVRTPVNSQLKVQVWEKYLSEYWDNQVVHLLKYGFPLDFNIDCKLYCDKQNHSSAVNYPNDIQAYLQEEISHGAILGPFSDNPVESAHYSPFMSRDKPGSKTRRVIIDLSWPKGNSINDGIHKDSYLGTDFALSFPTVDTITEALKVLGRGSHLLKIDVSRAFRHVKVDPADYDLLALHWQDKDFIDTYVPFGSRHGTQIFNVLATRYATFLEPKATR